MTAATVITAICGGLALVVVALLAFSFWRARELLRPVRTEPRFLPGDCDLPFEEVRIDGPRGTLAGWFVPALNGCTLICCHGIHDNRGQWVRQIAALRARSGYGALMFDFAGHGASDDSLVTYGAREVEDVAAVVEYLRSRGDVDMSRVGILGYSLGAITAVLAAAEQPELRAVVIESGFADVQHDVERLFTHFTGLPPVPFVPLIIGIGQLISGAHLAGLRPARVIGKISPRAVLVIADLEDALVDEPYDGEQLYTHAGEPKQLWQVPGAPHVGAFDATPDEWVRRVGEFLDRYLASAPDELQLPASSPHVESNAAPDIQRAREGDAL